jgi:type I restriction enzyme S subunit
MAASKPSAEQLITENIDVWTSAIKKRGSQGRGSSKKITLYGINKLRELILELAVRGLLVPQDPSDEPATVLLEKIAAEKEQLIKDGKLKEKKPLPKISEENQPYSLPNGWAWAVLPQVLADDKYSIKRGPFGSAIKKAFFVSQGYKVYEQQNAIYDNFGLGEYYIDEDKYNELKAFEVKSGDLIISCSGTVGRVAVAPDWMEKGVINQALLKITLNQEMLTNDYFKILFSAYYMKTETLTDLKGTAQKNMVSVNTLKNEPFPYPPYAELFRIVAKVNELMALCDQLEQQTESSLSAHKTLVETLLNTLLTAAQTTSTKESNSQSNSNQESSFDQAWNRIAQHFDVLFTTEHSIDQLKQTILQLAVMGKLVPQNPNDEPASVLLEKGSKARDLWLVDNLDDNPECKTMLKKLKKLDKPKEPFPIPSTWACAHLIQVSSLLVDCHNKTAPYEDDGIPIIRTTNIREREFKFAGMKYVNEDTYNYWSRRCPPAPGDIMFTREAPMGEGAIIPEGVKWCLGQRTMLIRPLHDFVSKEYLLLALTEPHLLERASEHAVGLTVKHLRVGDVERLNIPIPPLEEQHRIALRVSELMALCGTLKKRISELQTTQLHLADAVAENALNI